MPLRETQIAKRPGYICFMIFPHTLHYRQWLEEQQAEKISKNQAKKQCKPKRRKNERTTEETVSGD